MGNLNGYFSWKFKCEFLPMEAWKPMKAVPAKKHLHRHDGSAERQHCHAHDATILTRNAVDFAQVSGLHFENWLD